MDLPISERNGSLESLVTDWSFTIALKVTSLRSLPDGELNRPWTDGTFVRPNLRDVLDSAANSYPFFLRLRRLTSFGMPTISSSWCEFFLVLENLFDSDACSWYMILRPELSLFIPLFGIETPGLSYFLWIGKALGVTPKVFYVVSLGDMPSPYCPGPGLTVIAWVTLALGKNYCFEWDPNGTQP